jgi:O-antigen/teichoic acid export membrane protein
MDPAEFPKYVSSGMFVLLAGSLLIFGFFLLTSGFFTSQVQMPLFWLLVAPFYCLFQGVSQIVLGLLQMSKQSMRYGLYQVSMTSINLILSILLVVVFRLSWTGRVWGIFATYAIFMVIGVAFLIRKGYLIPQISKDYVKDIFWFGIPLLPHLLAGPLMQFSDRLLISKFVGNDWTGLYNVAFQIGNSIALVTVAFNQAWVPFLYGKLKNANASDKIKLVKQSYGLILAYFGIALLLIMFTPLIFRWFIDPNFYPAQQFVFLIALGSAINGIYFLVTNYIFYEKKTYILSWITVSNGVLSVLLNIFLIQKFGAWGAAYTFLITNIFLAVSVWILSNKVYPMPWTFFLKNKAVTK